MSALESTSVPSKSKMITRGLASRDVVPSRSVFERLRTIGEDSAARLALRLGGSRTSFEQSPEAQARAVQPGAHRALGHAKLVGDLLEAQVLVVVSQDDLPIVVGKLVERVAYLRVPLSVSHAFVGRRSVLGVVHGRKESELLEVEPFDETSAVATLRPHQHECLVGGHAEEPSREARIASKRAESTDDLEQGGLQKVTPILIRERIAQELALYVGTQRGHDTVQRGSLPLNCVGEQISVETECHGILDHEPCEVRAATGSRFREPCLPRILRKSLLGGLLGLLTVGSRDDNAWGRSLDACPLTETQFAGREISHGTAYGRSARLPPMAVVVVVGAQWGDEGKGKIVDLFTERADLVVRYAGGPNAGHTLVTRGEGEAKDDRIVVRLIPSGILRPSVRCVLGQGMVIDPESLVGEIDELVARGRLPKDVDARRLAVAKRAHAILPYHVLVDTLREKGEGAIGTTKRGVGPAYEDKVGRRGVPLGAFRDLPRVEALVRTALRAWEPNIRSLGGVPPDAGDIMSRVAAVAPRIVGLLADAASIVDDAVQTGRNVLLEGAQGTLLDVDHGTYPFVTSSSAVAGGACTGAGIGPTRIDAVIGLAKAYCTRVGSGPFPTELSDEVGERLRKRGDEFGSVTGRPRRTGWLDIPALRYAVRINGLSSLALTKLDVLTGLPKLSVCVAYEKAGSRLSTLPDEALETYAPVYETMDGWEEDLAGAKSLGDLPPAARRYVERIERLVGCPVSVLSVGSRRDQTLVIEHPFA
jgi:adenylosuccinate synthase